jgi:5-(aminomethyl)-3-furanmethanol phosphate kinase
MVDVVLKVGGGLLKQRGELDRVLAVISDLARHRRLLVVPGGGPFADAVRAVDDRLGLSDDTAHWMAIRAMDQYAQVVADQMPGCVLVAGPSEIAGALTAGRVPVLLPYRWLRDADPLPHSWDVTSDSIAAWVAGAVGARRLVLIKPSGTSGADLVDPYFHRALPASVVSDAVAADRFEALAAGIGGG